MAACGAAACGRGRTNAHHPTPTRARSVAASAGRGADETRTLSAPVVGGRDRRYLVHLPPRAGAARPALVLALHGGGGRAEGVAAQTGFSSLAEREGFVVAYPDGVDKGWNDGRDGVPSTAARENVDDVGFLAAVIDDVARRDAIDRSRVYVTGISNGAFMSSRFACERAELVAAIGLVAGTMGPELAAACRFARPVAVIAFLGTADPLVPYEGGVVHLGPFARGRTVSAHEAMHVFSAQSRCGAFHAQPSVPDVNPDDGSTARIDAAACAESTSVQLYTLEGGGHTWPGGAAYLPARFVGNVNRDVDATATMWAFFRERGRR